MPENKMHDNPYRNLYPRPHPNRYWSSSVSLFLSTHTLSRSLYTHFLFLSLFLTTHTLCFSLNTHLLSLFLSTQKLYIRVHTLSIYLHSLSLHTLYLSFPRYTHIHYLSFSLHTYSISLLKDKKSFNTAIPVRSLGPYMCIHYCTYIVHILV